MDNPGEILSLCRLCLVKDQVNIPIFEEQGDIRQIFLKISSCLPVKVSRDDQLPKRICDGCSNKLDLLYDFWNTSANAEKTLLSWLGQAGVKDADETISAVAQQIAKPAEAHVKEETLEDGNASHSQDDAHSFDEGTKDEAEAPPAKRARRTAAVKAQISITPESDEDDDLDTAEPMTKMEDESDESDGEDKDPSYTEVPGTSADDQAGPSGVGKDGVEAPLQNIKKEESIDIKEEETEYEESTAITKPVKPERNTLKQLLFCILCKFSCDDYYDFEDHLLDFPDNHRFFCQVCQQHCFDILELRRHRDQKHDSATFSEAELRFATENPGSVYYCDLCGTPNRTISEYDDHRKMHLVDMYFQCPACEQTFERIHALCRHFELIHALANNVNLHCSDCDCNFYCNEVYKHHMNTFHQMEEGMFSYQCILCPSVFTDNYNFSIHVRKHRKYTLNCFKKNPKSTVLDGKPTYNVTRMQCWICGKLDDKKKRHIKYEHHDWLKFDNNKIKIVDEITGNIKAKTKSNIFCNVCGSSFTDYFDYEKHILSLPESHSLPCAMCGLTFSRMLRLRDHSNRTHNSNEFKEAETKHVSLQYFCEFCGSKTKTYQEYSDHRSQKHKDWSFSCPVCQKKYMYISQLFTHFEKSHAQVNNVDLYCRTCRYHFYSAEVYAVHMQKVHRVNDPVFQCILCPSKLKLTENFIRHVHKHRRYKKETLAGNSVEMEDMRPLCDVTKIQCETCSKMYPKNLKEHINSTHDKYKLCYICTKDILVSKFASHVVSHGPAAVYETPESSTSDQPVFTVEEKQQQLMKAILSVGRVECYTCFGLVNKPNILDHNRLHRRQGIKINKVFPANIPLEKYPEIISCSYCDLDVRKSLINRHTEIAHKNDSCTSKRVDRIKRLSPNMRNDESRTSRYTRDRYSKHDKQSSSSRSSSEENESRSSSDSDLSPDQSRNDSKHRNLRSSRSSSSRKDSRDSSSCDANKRAKCKERSSRDSVSESDCNRRSRQRKSEERYYRSRSRGCRNRSRESFRERNYERLEMSRRDSDKTRSRDMSRSKSPIKQKEAAQVKCTECTNVYDSIENMVRHMKSAHFSPNVQNPLVAQKIATPAMPSSAYQHLSGIGQSNSLTQLFQHGVRYPNVAAVNSYSQIVQQKNRNPQDGISEFKK